jgi:hypothetical protein
VSGAQLEFGSDLYTEIPRDSSSSSLGEWLLTTEASYIFDENFAHVSPHLLRIQGRKGHRQQPPMARIPEILILSLGIILRKTLMRLRFHLSPAASLMSWTLEI